MLQLEIKLAKPKQKFTWGGARKRAGRHKTGKRRDPLHRTRGKVTRHQPQHVVLRTLPRVPRLRQGKVLNALRHTLRLMLARPDFRVVHISLQHNHLHLIVEADNKDALRCGMQGFAISAAKIINRLTRRKGKVFAFRYHTTSIKSPRQARHAMTYVLNNWRRHNEDERTIASRHAAIDPYSSATMFGGWKERDAALLPPGFDELLFMPLPVARPTSWLLTTGLGKLKPISVWEIPGPFGAGTH